MAAAARNLVFKFVSRNFICLWRRKRKLEASNPISSFRSESRFEKYPRKPLVSPPPASTSLCKPFLGASEAFQGVTWLVWLPVFKFWAQVRQPLEEKSLKCKFQVNFFHPIRSFVFISRPSGIAGDSSGQTKKLHRLERGTWRKKKPTSVIRLEEKAAKKGNFFTSGRANSARPEGRKQVD